MPQVWTNCCVRGIENLLITGVTTDVCCSATTIAANDRGFNALVVGDCVASYSPERHALCSR